MAARVRGAVPAGIMAAARPGQKGVSTIQRDGFVPGSKTLGRKSSLPDKRPTSGSGSDDAQSAASTPVRSPHLSADWRTAPARYSAGVFGWSSTAEKFTLAKGKEQKIDLRSPLPVFNGRLYLATSTSDPSPQAGVFFFSTDKFIKYMGFCADFGPFNLGMTHQFGSIMKEHLCNPRLSDSKIVYYCSPEAAAITNAVYNLGSFATVYLGLTPEEAWIPFSALSPSPFKPYRDATWAPSPFDLTLKDCWAGIMKAVSTGLYTPASFDKEEYFYYDHPANGDIHEVVKNKFFAFKGPTGRRRALGFGRYTLIPSDYFDVFRSKNITTVVRLNSKEYDRNVVLQGNFKHHDLFFIDCSTPSDAIVDRFFRIAETESGAIAVHCLAGLGRTGTLIALYMMKHFRFTARESIAWLRICRPGSVIGPQQQYLCEQEQRMWDLGEKKAFALGIEKAPPMSDHEGNEDTNSSQLAAMVTKGMQNRDVTRVASSDGKLSTPVSQSHVRQSSVMLSGSNTRPVNNLLNKAKAVKATSSSWSIGALPLSTDMNSRQQTQPMPSPRTTSLTRKSGGGATSGAAGDKVRSAAYNTGYGSNLNTSYNSGGSASRVRRLR